MLQIVGQTRHHGGGGDQNCEDAGPVAGIAVTPVEEIAEDRREVGRENGGDENGRDPEGDDRQKCGVDDSGDGEDRGGDGEGEMPREIGGFVGFVKGALDVDGERIEVVAGERRMGYASLGRSGARSSSGMRRVLMGSGRRNITEKTVSSSGGRSGGTRSVSLLMMNQFLWPLMEMRPREASCRRTAATDLLSESPMKRYRSAAGERFCGGAYWGMSGRCWRRR